MGKIVTDDLRLKFTIALIMCSFNRVGPGDYLNTFAFMDKLAENLRAKLGF